MKDKAKLINTFTSIPIVDRDFKWYYSAAYVNLLDTAMTSTYDSVLNSEGYSNQNIDDIVCKGAKEVFDHVEKYGFNSEKTEYMYELAMVDNWLYTKYLKDDIE